MKNPIAIVNNDFDDFMTIDLMVTNKCNFSCHYCHPGSNTGTIGFFQDYELLLKNLSHVIDIYRNHFNKKRIKFEITGGEPTVWPKLGDFAKWLKIEKQIENVFLVSNGSRTMRWWETYAHYFDEVHLSLHNVEGDPAHMIKVADYIYNNTDALGAVNVLMDPTNWERSLSYLNKMIDHPTPWLTKSWVLIENGELRKDYTPDQLELFKDKVQKKPPEEKIQYWIKKGTINQKTSAKIVYDTGDIGTYNSFMLRMTHQHNFFGWRCNLGIDRLVFIGPELHGSCGATNFFNSSTKFLLDDPEFVRKFTVDVIQPIICQQPSCGLCTKDLKLSKAKIHETDIDTK